jgi:hypothetical protein
VRKNKPTYYNLGGRTRKVPRIKKKITDLDFDYRYEKGSRRNKPTSFYINPTYKALYIALGVRSVLKAFEGVPNFLQFICTISKKTFVTLLSNGQGYFKALQKLYTRVNDFYFRDSNKGNDMVNGMTDSPVTEGVKDFDPENATPDEINAYLMQKYGVS